MCKEQNGVGSCFCPSQYIGNPYEGCRPECIINSDCHANLACIGYKCQNPCLGMCSGRNSYCQVVSHLPICSCLPGSIGDPFVSCSYDQESSKSKSIEKNMKTYYPAFKTYINYIRLLKKNGFGKS